ncbi:hypothetical protein QCE47_27160 [Caballeronia sp. LZ025]|uniref:hypothetical protein n=1 Tax=Caballeronia TaxID=1827195 RepID=UPI001FD60C92|nr:MULTISPECIES: hypothetical protein [Caballeronia]MDR5735998.1 hypothetical protein [Caballeronia sp. LZ025]
MPFALPALLEAEEPDPPPHAASTATVKAVKAERRMDGNAADDCFKPDLVKFVDAVMGVPIVFLATDSLAFEGADLKPVLGKRCLVKAQSRALADQHHCIVNKNANLAQAKATVFHPSFARACPSQVMQQPTYCVVTDCRLVETWLNLANQWWRARADREYP